MKQFPELPSLQNTLTITWLHPAEEGSFFYHNFCGHQALSRLADGKMHVYDSMQPRSLTPAIIEQLCSLYGHLKKKNKLEIILPHVQKQQGTSDCGCFAISFSVSLMFGENPLELVYVQKELHYHIADCFSVGCFTWPPSMDRKAKCTSPLVHLIHLCHHTSHMILFYWSSHIQWILVITT